MISRATLCAALLACACQAHSDAAGFGGPGMVWQLSALDDDPVTFTAELTFPQPGRVSGRAPCNRFSGDLRAAFPDFRVDRIVSTKRACPELRAERRFIAALGAADRATRDGDRLILSSESGPRLTFTRAE